MLSTEAGTQEVHDMLAEIMISEKLLVAEWPQRDMGKFASLSWGKMNSTQLAIQRELGEEIRSWTAQLSLLNTDSFGNLVVIMAAGAGRFAHLPYALPPPITFSSITFGLSLTLVQ